MTNAVRVHARRRPERLAHIRMEPTRSMAGAMVSLQRAAHWAR